MDSLDRCTQNLGADNEGLEVDSDVESEDVRPFTPTLPNEKTPYIHQIGSECSKSGSSRVFGDGFREIEICPHVRRKGNKVHPLVDATPSVHIISDSDGGRVESLSKENRLGEPSISRRGNDALFQKQKRPKVKGKKHSEGLVLQKRGKDQENKTDKGNEGENASNKYGVTMSVKSGVKRTPWHSSVNGSNGEGSSKESSGGSNRPKRKSTEETILASSFSSSNSSLSAENDILKGTRDAQGEINLAVEGEEFSPGDAPRPIPTISQIADSRDRKSLTSISLATYNNIQKEGVPKRGNCILCFAATLTFVVTLVLTIAILIAPKSFGSKDETLPTAILNHISSANTVPRGSKKTTSLSLKSDKVTLSSDSFPYEYFLNTTNYTEALPKR